MDDSFLQELLIANEPGEKAALVAESVFSTLPRETALIARRCSVLHWFDEAVVDALLKDIPHSERQMRSIYEQIRSLPFIEVLPWGLAFNSTTREGLIKSYAATQPQLLRTAAKLAAPAYRAIGTDEKLIAEAFFCYIIAGKTLRAQRLLNEIVQQAITLGNWERVSGFLRLAHEAQQLPSVSSLPYSSMLESHHRDLELIDPELVATAKQMIRNGEGDASILYGAIRLRKIEKNTFILLLAQIVTWISLLVLASAYGRFLGDVKFGELYLAITFVTLIGFPLVFGFNPQLVRGVAQDPNQASRYFSNTLLIKVTLWFVLYGLILLLCWLLGYSVEERILVAIVGISMLSTSLANTIAALHYAFARALYPAIGTILEKGLSALVGVVLLSLGGGVETMALVLLGGSLISMAWQAFWFFRLISFKFSLDLRLIRELIRASIPSLIYGVLGVFDYRIGAVLLSLMTNVAVVGWYGAGYTLFNAMTFLPNVAITAIMYPVFSKFSSAAEANLKTAIEKSMNFLLFCGIPIAAIMIAAAPNIIGFLYHRAEFNAAVPVLQVLAPGLVLLYINIVLSTIIMSMKQETKITVMAAGALVFNLGLNLIMIPRFQQTGAAIVTSLTELLLFCISITFIPRRLLSLQSVWVGGKALIASLVMILAVYLLRSFSIFVLLLIAMFVYFSIALMIGVIPREDIKAIYRAIRLGESIQIIPPESYGHQRKEESKAQKGDEIYYDPISHSIYH